MVHKRVRRFVRKVFRRKSAPTPTGGQSRPSDPVLVTPSGRVVGTARPPALRPRPRPSGRGGGQSRPSGPVLVTPSGRVVGTARVPRKPFSGLTRTERSALVKREQIRLDAKRRGKGFTRLEVRRRLGGGTGVVALRSARRKGFRVITERPRHQKKRTFNVLTTPEKNKGLRRIIDINQKEFNELKTKKSRGRKLTTSESFRFFTTQANIRMAGGLLGVGRLVKLGGKGIRNIPKIPEGTRKLIKNRKNIIPVTKETSKKVIKSIGRGAANFGTLLRTGEPGEIAAVIGTEIIIFRGTGKGFQVVGKLSSKATTQLIKTTPKFSKVKGGKIIVKSEVPGKKIVLDVSGKTAKKIGIPLKEQIKISGRRTTVVSAQADRIINLLKTKRVIRKPIPNEAQLKTSTKKLLNRFDRGRITKKQLIQLDKRIKSETGRQGSLLERSLFASPKGKLRVSRLGRRQREATLLDILSGDVTFKTLKPQILIFEKVKVQKLPKTLGDIEKKIKAGKSLTRNEANRLLQFQLKKSSKFKPIGALSREPEVTLAPGEIIKKVKTIAFTEIRGKRIPIIRAEVIKPKPSTAKLLRKARAGKIKTRELKKLRSNLKKETGFKTSLSRRTRRPKPRVRIPKPLPRRISRKPPRPRPRPPGRPRPRPPGRPAPRGGRAPPKIPPRGRPGTPIIPIKIKKKIRKVKKKPTKLQAFNVWARPLKRKGQKKRPKLVKVNLRPLSKQRAEDLRNFIADESLSRTARIKPTSGKPRQPKLRVPKSFSKRTSKKFRRHRQVKGRRVGLPKGKVIEKSRFLLDTKSEKKGITLLRKIAELERKAGIRKLTPNQRSKLLKNLKKARAVRSQNSKGGKK